MTNDWCFFFKCIIQGDQGTETMQSISSLCYSMLLYFPLQMVRDTSLSYLLPKLYTICWPNTFIGENM